jgi:hypothetical protein
VAHTQTAELVVSRAQRFGTPHLGPYAPMINTRACILATLVGTVLQLAMVLAGHTNASIAGLFPVGGMGISLLAGLAYTALARGGGARPALIGGALAGGACALIGIAVSCVLGDVSPSVLVYGTASSAVTGALGGWLGRFLPAPTATNV